MDNNMRCTNERVNRNAVAVLNPQLDCGLDLPTCSLKFSDGDIWGLDAS